MAWRIDEFVVRGEIDNRTRDRVTARIWFVDRAEPVELDLAGNAWRDLAGRRLEFVNPDPKPGLSPSLASLQTGVIGDCTASRKVKVPDIPLDQIGDYYKARKPFPWHWGNSVYFEWFSETNGRVVIESASYRLTISSDSTWEMTEAEESAQREANGEAMIAMMARLTGDAPITAADVAAAEDTAWNESEDAPPTEEEAERRQEESDRLVDRITARLQSEGPNADYEAILREELDRRRRERGDAPLTPEQEAERAVWYEEINRAAEEAANDPELREEFLDEKHPLAERAYELTVRLLQQPQERGWVPADASEEHPVVDMVASVSKASAKLAGALDGAEWPQPLEECADTIVRLKRARRYFDDALRAADGCDELQLVDRAWLAEVQREVTTLADETDILITELRERLNRGFE